MVQDFSAQIPTFTYPNGALTEARIVPNIGDLQAMRKWAGFLGRSTRMFCWFCECSSALKRNLNHQNWKYRTNQKVREEVNNLSMLNYAVELIHYFYRHKNGRMSLELLLKPL